VQSYSFSISLFDKWMWNGTILDNRTRLLMKLLTTSSADIILECRVMFGVKSVSKSILSAGRQEDYLALPTNVLIAYRVLIVYKNTVGGDIWCSFLSTHAFLLGNGQTYATLGVPYYRVSHIFMSRNFHPCKLVLQIHVSHFPPLQHGAAFSCPASSWLAFSASPGVATLQTVKPFLLTYLFQFVFNQPFTELFHVWPDPSKEGRCLQGPHVAWANFTSLNMM